MSSISVSTADIDNVKSVRVTFTRFWSFLLICLGTIGHSLSIYVFTRSTFRSNPCVRYFLAATICGILVTYGNTPLRLLQTGYSIDVFGYSLI